MKRAAMASCSRQSLRKTFKKNERLRGRASEVHSPMGYDDSLVDTYLNGGEDVYE